MRNVCDKRGFSLVELLIVVAIIAIIAAIAIPNLLTVKMAANEAVTIASLKAYGSAQTVYSLTNNQKFASISGLVNEKMLDERWSGGAFNGYNYISPTVDGDPAFQCDSTPIAPGKTGRYRYRIATNQVVLFAAAAGGDPAAVGGAPNIAGVPAISAGMPGGELIPVENVEAVGIK